MRLPQVHAEIEKLIERAGVGGILLEFDDFHYNDVEGLTLDGIPADQWVEMLAE